MEASGSGGAVGDVQQTAESMAHHAVELASSGADVPREALGGVLAAIARTTRAIGDFVEKLEGTISG